MTGKKKILLSILILLCIAASIGYYLFTKGPADVEHASGTKVSAEELYKIFSTDSATAKINYAGKILEVSGVVATLSKNQQNQDIVLLKTASAGASVNATMEEKDIKIKPGDKLVIKGICSGIGQGDADLGILGDVYLLRCYVSNKLQD